MRTRSDDSHPTGACKVLVQRDAPLKTGLRSSILLHVACRSALPRSNVPLDVAQILKE
jgi:hypothetical protein